MSGQPRTGPQAGDDGVDRPLAGDRTDHVAELAESGWRGRCFLMILSELVQEDPANLDKDVNEVLTRTGGYAVYAVLEERMAPVRNEVRLERLALATGFILRAVGDRARAMHRRSRRGHWDRGRQESQQLHDEDFRRHR